MKSDKQQKNNLSETSFDFEAESNLIGFFKMLNDIHRRENPDLYKKEIISTNEKEI